MTSNQDLHKRREAAVPRGVTHATQRYAVRAENAEIWDADGNCLIDFGGGIGVLNTGHRHPKVLAAAQKQLEAFIHSCFQVMPYEPYIALAEKLNELAPIPGAKKSVFLTTGAEAVENAVKIARAYTGRPGIIAFSGAFHGRTMMGMALTGKVTPYKLGFGPFPADVYHARFPHPYHGVSVEQSLSDIEHLFKTEIEAKRVAAFILEPVQGEGGFTVAPPEFMTALRKIADANGSLIIADEVQSGFARTGKFFAMEHFDVHADLITVAKSIGGGFPLSGVVGKAEVMDGPAPGGLGGTYGGNPVSCAAALAVIDAIHSEGLLQRSTELGTRFKETMKHLQQESRYGIGEVRGLGGMVAFEVIKPGTENTPDPDRTKALALAAAELGLLLLTCGVYANTIRVLVPLTISDELFTTALSRLQMALEKVSAN